MSPFATTMTGYLSRVTYRENRCLPHSHGVSGSGTVSARLWQRPLEFTAGRMATHRAGRALVPNLLCPAKSCPHGTCLHPCWGQDPKIQPTALTLPPPPLKGPGSSSHHHTGDQASNTGGLGTHLNSTLKPRSP